MFTVTIFFAFIVINLLFVLSMTPKNVSYDYSDHVPRVVNGWPGKLGDVPYQISFKMLVRGTRIYASFCGGSIIAPSKLLSAGHCFANDRNICSRWCGGLSKSSLTNTMAVAGNLRNRDYYQLFDSSQNGQWRGLKSVVIPPTYKFPKDDIAIVFTNKEFVYNTNVNSIPIASQLIDYHGDCLVSGFGRISNQLTSDKLLLAHLTLMPMWQCDRMHRKYMRRFVCTSTKVTDVGKGDSGGPLVCSNTGDPNEIRGKGVLVGIVSGNRRFVSSFFTRVSSFYRYIERNECTLYRPDITFCSIIVILQTKLLLF